MQSFFVGGLLKDYKLSCWQILSFAIIALFSIIFFDFLYRLLQPVGENWLHVRTYLLPSYIQETLLLCLAVGVGVSVLGAILAWLVTMFEFPASKYLAFLMLLPLTIPPYIGGYTYANILSYTGIVQITFRKFGYNIGKYIDIMNMYGAVAMFVLFLLPYVYIVVSSYFHKQSSAYLETSRLLGANEWRIFRKVLVPLARGPIIAGTTLALLEVLSDYGVVSYFGLGTLSAAIFNSWFGLGDVNLALRMAGVLLLLVAIFTLGERWSRRHMRYTGTTKSAPLHKKRLHGSYAWVATLLAYGYVLFAFFIPTLQLLYWSYLSYKDVLTMEFVELALASLSLAIITSLLVVIISVIIANNHRLNRSALSSLYSNITLIGYSVPGTVVAIIMIKFFIDLDLLLAPVYHFFLNNPPTLLLSMSIIMLVAGYIIRFLGVGFQPIEGGFEKMGKAYYEAGVLLGKTDLQTFFRIDLPLLKPALISGFSLVFVDIIKELPLALFLRPFNFHTLATRVFNYANDEQVIEGAIPSLFIIVISAIFIAFLYFYTKEEEC